MNEAWRNWYFFSKTNSNFATDHQFALLVIYILNFFFSKSLKPIKKLFGHNFERTVQYRKWSPTSNDPETANDPQNGPQMIRDRKWSPKMTANDPVKIGGMDWILWDWLQKRTDYKKNFFLAPSKEKGKEDATCQVNLYKAKKKKVE